MGRQTKVRRPERVKIGPLWFDIVWVAGRYEIVRGENVIGQIDWTEKRIRLLDGLSAAETACNFMHEAMHGILEAVLHAKQSYPPEEIADYGSYGVVQFWQDNPEAFDWWIGLVRGE